MRRLAFALLFLAAAAAHAQTATQCNPTQQDCTINETFTYYRQSPVMNAIATEVVDTNRATTSPDPFTTTRHNTYEDFLNLFSLAISDVERSETEQGIVVRFNPLREGRNLVGLTLTVAEPSISPLVQNAIPEATRAATVSQLQQTQQNTDDLTWSASYSYATTQCGPSVPSTQRCYGRTPRQYGDLLAAALGTPTVTNVAGAAQLARLFPESVDSVFQAKLSQASDRNAALQLVQQLVAAEKTSSARVSDAFTSLHLDLLPTLIDNQPQITASLNYHTPGDLGGPKETSASLEVHFGRENVNTLRKRCAAMTDTQLTTCLQQQLATFAQNGMSTDKFVFSATYQKSSAYQVTTLPLSSPVEGFTAVDVKSGSALNVVAQAGRQISSDFNGEPLRADFSLEGVRNMNNSVLTENRWIATLTISVPVGNNITVPVSVTYANKAEFLGDPNQRLGAHLGLSYRLPGLGTSP